MVNIEWAIGHYLKSFWIAFWHGNQDGGNVISCRAVTNRWHHRKQTAAKADSTRNNWKKWRRPCSKDSTHLVAQKVVFGMCLHDTWFKIDNFVMFIMFINSYASFKCIKCVKWYLKVKSQCVIPSLHTWKARFWHRFDIILLIYLLGIWYYRKPFGLIVVCFFKVKCIFFLLFVNHLKIFCNVQTA